MSCCQFKPTTIYCVFYVEYQASCTAVLRYLTIQQPITCQLLRILGFCKYYFCLLSLSFLILALSLLLVADGSYIATVSHDRTIKLWSSSVTSEQAMDVD